MNKLPGDGVGSLTWNRRPVPNPEKGQPESAVVTWMQANFENGASLQLNTGDLKSGAAPFSDGIRVREIVRVASRSKRSIEVVAHDLQKVSK